MNEQESAPVAKIPAQRRVSKDEAVSFAWHQAGLDTDSGVLIPSVEALDQEASRP